MVHPESRIEVAQMDEAVDQQSRADKQNKRNRDFADDKDTANTIAAHARAGIPAAFLERVVQVEVRCLGRGRESKNYSGRERNESGEEEHFAVDADRLGLRNRVGNKTFQDTNPGDGEQ